MFFRSEINCNLSTPEEIDEFVRNYSLQNDETLRKRTPKINKSSNKFRYVIYYRCQHRTTHAPSFNPVENVLSQKPSKRVKNTDCPFPLCLKLRNSPSPESETVDPYPCVVSLQWNHNHPVKSLQALGFKDIPSAVSERIMAMFKRGYTPGLAYREFIRTLTRECENDLELHKALADRSKIPRRPNFNQLYSCRSCIRIE